MKSKIHKNVILGKNCLIENNCEVGRPPRGKKEGEAKTVIGDNAHLRSGTVIYAGVEIGDNFQTGHNAMIREGNKIGNNVSVGTNSCIEVENVIGDNVRIQSLCFMEKASIEENVFLGPSVTFLDDPHPNIPRGLDCMRGVTVKKGARIGGSVTILPYVVVEENSFVGAGSVVTKDVPKNQVVVGNPAHKLKEVMDIVCEKRNKPHKPYDSVS